jgi:hypothetical protein
MHIVCTICCKEKTTNLEPIAACERYLSGRINDIYVYAKKNNTPFRIFSGVYGLLKPSDLIPYYDKKLEKEEVLNMSELLAKQFLNEKITEIDFFYENDDDWKPYISAMEQAAIQSSVKLTFRLYFPSF